MLQTWEKLKQIVVQGKYSTMFFYNKYRGENKTEIASPLLLMEYLTDQGIRERHPSLKS